MAREEDARVLVTSASLDSGAEVFVDQQGRVTVVDWNRTVIEHTGEAGTMPEVASPLRRFREFQSRIEGGNYRCVVLDLPPVHENGTALALASSLDGVVIIIESEKDHRAVVRHCLELLGEARVPVLGAVLNKFNTYVPRWLSGEA
jgi:Mrp family chromosome partitioning ATPase